MLDIRPIDAAVSVAPQIDPADLPAIRAAGFAMVVNNRPDGESPGQPSGAEIAVACAEAGLGYVAIPVTQAGFSHTQVDAMRAAMGEAATAGGAVLAYCRSGTRSCNLWALAAAAGGADADAVTALGAGAGYDLAPLRPLMDAVSPAR